MGYDLVPPKKPQSIKVFFTRFYFSVSDHIWLVGLKDLILLSCLSGEEEITKIAQTNNMIKF